MAEAQMEVGEDRQKRPRAGVFAAYLLLRGAIGLFLLSSLVVLGIGLAAIAASRNPALHLSLHESGLGSGLRARISQGIADASHRVEPAPALGIDYLFSLFNLGLAVFLVWLRPRDRTANLLAVGMIGTAAVFNLQAVSVYEALPKTILETSLFSLHQLLAGGAYVAALLLFPDGRLIPRWPRWAQAALYLPLGALVTRLAFIGADVETTSNIVRTILFFGLLTPLAAVFSQGYRYRRSPTAEQRQQSKLLFWALVPALAVGLFVLTKGVRSALAPEFEGRSLHDLPHGLFRVFQPVFALIPIALFIGLIRYRLWKIDRVISRTLLYGLLVASITGIYVGVVVGLGRLVGAGANNLALSVAATGLVAIGFQPAKERLQRLANRVVYGKRATPYEVLSELSKGMVEAYGTEELLERMARGLAEGTAAEASEVWLRVGAELRLAAAYPPRPDGADPKHLIDAEVPDFPGWDKACPVRHQSELLGILAVRKPEGESLSLSEDKLVSDLASQAALFLRNVRLTAELLDRLEDLRASRQRLVSAQDEERRRIERNLHDGAQQQLVALKMKLALAEKIAGQKGPELKPLLAQFRQDADEALETLRDLARGIYPPLLAAEGLVAALSAHARKLPIDVEVTGDDIPRLGQEVEAAVYFCCLEALQNVLKYAEASRAEVHLARVDHRLEVAVTDDGKGFDCQTVGKGAGLQNMEDRIEALGGNLKIKSVPGRGTSLTVVVPLQQAQITPSSSGSMQDGDGSPAPEVPARPGAEPQPA